MMTHAMIAWLTFAEPALVERLSQGLTDAGRRIKS
jgi:hypothetical protein